MLPKYIQWKKHFDKDDNDSLEFNLISFIEQLDDEEIYSYYTDAILELAKQWDDDHGCGIIDMIRFSIIDQLLCKRQLPGSPLDHSCPNKWIDQVCESVHDGQLNYMRPLKIYYSDDDLCSTKETELRNSMIMFKDKSVNEQIFFYHGTTEFHAENIITRGIRLFSRMSRPGDFGYGFYTTHSFSEALRHAKKGQQEQVVNNEPRALKMDDSSINSNNILQWNIFVYKCLNDDPPLPLIHDKDCIIGPISANLKDITLGYKPIKRRGRSTPTQTAVISMKMAYALLDGLKGVIIWGKKT
ncbi:unnamed protein product [Rotaria magnacalcarata]|uniref:Uncharacterized protein n=2 Tax=Rotaria magnacalcarata TaxID=392030 RepID=A0A816N733_9BILA|nr:unnamed protein product [Rotaria magnacalcarata]CAF2031621.1 unnamed protein product [Rotaria magnacalcarata]